ncbi:MAG: hypothetical protein LBQ22_03350 [Bacteroidales bacterium]|jgi:hypothetical protein|nr:hypothetical protein [Bacteroidales bacterium]
MNLRKTIGILFLVITISSCLSKKNWEQAHITYKDESKSSMNVYPGRNSYYNLIHAKKDIKAKKEFLLPEDVKTVENEQYKYVSMYFDEENFGMESYGFGKVMAGDEIMIVKTKFREKTCACKTSGAYFKGHFLVYNNDIQRIRTDKRSNIINNKEIQDFMDKYSDIDLPQKISTVDDLIEYIKNINN